MAKITARESEILKLLGEQLANPEIAGRLNISVRTVESHVAALIQKLDLPSRRAVAAYAVDQMTRQQLPRDVPIHYVSRDGVYIAYQVMGTGPPDSLLLLDGVVPLETTLELPSLRRFVERLESGARVIRLDRRGLGLSDPINVEEPPTMSQWAADAVAVLDAVRARRPVLVGLAEGSTLAAFIAATHPARVGGLVLVHPVPGASQLAGRSGLIHGNRKKVQLSYDAPWRKEAVPGDLATFAPSRAMDPGYRRWLLRSLRKAARSQTGPALFDALHRADAEGLFDRIRTPTLVIHRSGNRYVGPSYARWVASRIRGARYLEVAGEDHVPYLGDAEPVLTAIERFLLATQGKSGGTAH